MCRCPTHRRRRAVRVRSRSVSGRRGCARFSTSPAAHDSAGHQRMGPLGGLTDCTRRALGTGSVRRQSSRARICPRLIAGVHRTSGYCGRGGISRESCATLRICRRSGFFGRLRRARGPEPRHRRGLSQPVARAAGLAPNRFAHCPGLARWHTRRATGRCDSSCAPRSNSRPPTSRAHSMHPLQTYYVRESLTASS